MKRMITVELDADLFIRLDRIASRAGTSVDYQLALALTNYLDDREDYLLATAALEEFLQSGETAIDVDSLPDLQ